MHTFGTLEHTERARTSLPMLPEAVACADSGALSCLCIGAQRASSRCMGGHASATTHRIMSDLPPPAAQARIIRAVCFHIGYDGGEDILLQLSRAPGPAFLGVPDRCFGLAPCRNAPPRPGSRRSPSQPAATSRGALAASCAQAGCLLSSVCSCMSVRRDFGQTDRCESTIGPTCPCCEV